jgi:hypothetical protein
MLHEHGSAVSARVQQDGDVEVHDGKTRKAYMHLG